MKYQNKDLQFKTSFNGTMSKVEANQEIFED